MARMKFLCDAERCIECNGCVTACKQEHEIPWGVNRRRVVTINDGVPGERSISVACMHCSDAPCMAVCPVDCFYRTDDGVVLRLAGGDAAVALDAALGVAEKLHSGHDAASSQSSVRSTIRCRPRSIARGRALRALASPRLLIPLLIPWRPGRASSWFPASSSPNRSRTSWPC